MTPASDGQVERLLSGLLRAGVLTSLALVVTGTLLTFLHHPDYLFSPEALPPLLHHGAGIEALARLPADLLALRGQAFVLLGLACLLATPVLRVAFSIAIFRARGDRPFTLITSLVLGLLLLSFLLGRAGG